MTLDEIGLKYNSDKSSNFHDYLNLYDTYLKEYRYKDNTILEIGILNGDSLNIFSEYFENSKIYGIDIHDKSFLNIKNCKTIIGDQSDKVFLNTFLEDDLFDIIIDDGSHKMAHQQISLGILFKRLKSNGIYVIEDLHTSLPTYIETLNYGKSLFGLNQNCDNNTIDFLKNIKNKNSKNYYLTDEEISFLYENIKDINIIETAKRNDNNKSITSIITKK